MSHAVSVPTATLVGYDPSDLRRVVIVKFRAKHSGGRGLPGGRVEFQTETALEAIVREAREEANAEVLWKEARLLPVLARSARDVRSISRAKYLHEPVTSAEPLVGHYDGNFVVAAPVLAIGSLHGDPEEIASVAFESVEDDAIVDSLILDFPKVVRGYRHLAAKAGFQRDRFLDLMPEIIFL